MPHQLHPLVSSQSQDMTSWPIQPEIQHLSQNMSHNPSNSPPGQAMAALHLPDAQSGDMQLDPLTVARLYPQYMLSTSAQVPDYSNHEHFPLQIGTLSQGQIMVGGGDIDMGMPTTGFGLAPPGMIPGAAWPGWNMKIAHLQHNAASLSTTTSMPPLHEGALPPRRRMPIVSSDPVKHRRTRSGCMTCRNRRVKCDEARPVCERCKKGSRECCYLKTSIPKPRNETTPAPSDRPAFSPTSEAYHDGQNNGSPNAQGNLAPNSPVSPGQESNSQSKQGLATILDVAEMAEGQSPETRPSPTSSFDVGTAVVGLESTMNLDLMESWLEATDIQASIDLDHLSNIKLDFSTPADYHNSDHQRIATYYMAFHLNYLAPFHYGIRNHTGGFFGLPHLTLAKQHRHLFFAVLALSAYYHSVTFGGPDIAVFATFQNISLRILRQSIEKDDSPPVATLLCVLQLGKLEELTGGRSGLILHRQAARWMLLNKFSPSNLSDPSFSFALSLFLTMDMPSGTLFSDSTRSDIEWNNIHDDYIKASSNALDVQTAALLMKTHTSYLRHLMSMTEEPLKSDLSSITRQLKEYEDTVQSIESRLADSLLELKGQLVHPAKSMSPFGSGLELIPGEKYSMNLVILEAWTTSTVNYYHTLTFCQRFVDDDELLAFKERTCNQAARVLIQSFLILESIHQCVEQRPMGVMAALGPVFTSLSHVLSALLPTISAPDFNLEATLFSSPNPLFQFFQSGSQPVRMSLPLGAVLSEWIGQKLSVIEKAGYHFPFSVRDSIRQHLAVDSAVGSGGNTTVGDCGSNGYLFSSSASPDYEQIMTRNNLANGSSSVLAFLPQSPVQAVSPGSILPHVVSQELRAYVRNRGYTTDTHFSPGL